MKSDYIKTLNKNYQNALMAFTRDIPDKSLINYAAIDSYVRNCAISIWAKGDANVEECRSVLSEIYTLPATRVIYDSSEVAKTLDFYKTHNASQSVPEFFVKLVSYDILHKTSFSRALAEIFEVIFIHFAVIDERIWVDTPRNAVRRHESVGAEIGAAPRPVPACDADSVVEHKHKREICR